MERDVVRPRLLRSWGLWAPVAVAAVSAARLLFTDTSSMVVFDGILIALAVAVLISMLYGGAVVGPDGIRSRRITRDRRQARWDEVLGFVAVPREPVRVRLVDGTEMRLFDYSGDNDYVVAALEQARERYTNV